MSVETEAKLRVDSHEPVRERLRALGATFVEKVLETNVIFDRADGSLRKEGCGLRLRSTVREDGGDARVMLTFKGPRAAGPYKKREELEVRLEDLDAASAILERLGFLAILHYQKRRESWSWGSCRIELDDPPHIGRFVEIEGPDEEAIRSVQAELGLGDVPHTDASYVRMLLEYCQERGLTKPVVMLG
jgi:adenylate cyclase class 2